MSVKQDRFTFFGVLVAVVIVVLGYLQIAQMYPVAGREDRLPEDASAPSSGSDGRLSTPHEHEEESRP